MVVSLLAAALALPAAAAPVDCAAPNGLAQVRGCEAASKGVTELRMFVQRTRAIYGLYAPDFDRAVPPAVASAPRQDDRTDRIAAAK
jgi:hypothetical protein